jgi:hypothetical protein
MIKLLGLVLLAGLAFGVDSDSKKPSFAEEAYNKSVEANSKDVYKTYVAYTWALEVANQKIVKDLEKIKVDLNDTEKWSMSLTNSYNKSSIFEPVSFHSLREMDLPVSGLRYSTESPLDNSRNLLYLMSLPLCSTSESKSVSTSTHFSPISFVSLMNFLSVV